MAFMDTSSIEATLTNSDLEYFSGTQSFVGLLELISLKDDDFKKKLQPTNLLLMLLNILSLYLQKNSCAQLH